MFTTRLLTACAGAILLGPLHLSWSQSDHRATATIDRQRDVATRFVQSSGLARATANFAASRIHRDAWIENGWVPQSRTSHTFSGQRRAQTWEFEWTGETWVPTLRMIYDDNGMVQTVDAWDPTSQAPSPRSQFAYEYAYDFTSNRNVLSAVVEREWDGSVWRDRLRTTYTIEHHAVDGLRPVGAQFEVWGVTDWDPVEHFVLIEKGADVIQEYRAWDGSAWVNAYRIAFSNHTISSLRAYLAFVTARYGEFSDLQLSLLMLPTSTYQEWTGTEWENVSRQSIESFHFVTGDPGAVLYESWENGDWVPEARLQMHFEAFNQGFRIASSTLQVPSPVGWMPIVSEVYTHDDRRLLTEATRRAGNVGIFQNTARYSYEWQDLSVGRDDEAELPARHVLEPAYPNPFNPSTSLAYRIATADNVRIEVRDLLGRLVGVLVDEFKPAGTYRAEFDGDGVPSGVYAIRLVTPGHSQTRLVTLVK